MTKKKLFNLLVLCSFLSQTSMWQRDLKVGLFKCGGLKSKNSQKERMSEYKNVRIWY